MSDCKLSAFCGKNRKCSVSTFPAAMASKARFVRSDCPAQVSFLGAFPEDYFLMGLENDGLQATCVLAGIENALFPPSRPRNKLYRFRMLKLPGASFVLQSFPEDYILFHCRGTKS